MKASIFYRMGFAMLALVLLTGQGCTKGVDQATQAAAEPKTIEIWGVVDDRDAYDAIFKAYRAAHPQINIVYKRFRLEEYEDLLIDAFAEDRGPDIFLIHNTWIGKYLSKIKPMPDSTEMVYIIVEGSYTNRKETLVLKDEKSITLREVRNNYPDVVGKDVIRQVNMAGENQRAQLEERVVGLPMSVDTMAMYVNRDILNSAGIPTIPTEWSAFQSTMARIVEVDTEGSILQAGTAMGATENIERPSDLLSVLMMQNGTVMATEQGVPTFALMPEALAQSRNELPAIQALRFYNDFADETKEIYSWNEDMPQDIDAFVEGRLAYYFGYAYHLPTIKSRAPKLNLAIARLPQIEGNPEVNYANYWVWTVSKKSEESDTAWNLINFMTKVENEKLFLDAARRPPAHRSLIEDYLDDEEMGVFASQILTAQSWYRGYDAATMEQAMKSLVDTTKTMEDERDWEDALGIAQQTVYQTMRPKETP